MEDCGFIIKYVNCVSSPLARDVASDNKKGSFKMRLKKYIYKYTIVRRMIYLLWHFFRHISALKKYYFSNHAIELLSSKNFVYGDDRNCIRICVVKK